MVSGRLMKLQTICFLVIIINYFIMNINFNTKPSV